jgi:hypothetical protein
MAISTIDLMRHQDIYIYNRSTIMLSEHDLTRRWSTIDELVYQSITEDPLENVVNKRLFGSVKGPATDTLTDVSSLNTVVTLPTTAAQVSVVSDSTLDTNTGTGAQIVVILGLDENYEPLRETVITNGTTPVLTVNSFLRLNTMTVGLSGSSQSNVGDIVGSINGDDQIEIPAGEGISQSSMFTIPAGYSGILVDYLMSVYRSAGGSSIKEAETLLTLYNSTSNTSYTVSELGIRNDGNNSTYISRPLAPKIAEKTTMRFQTTVASSNTAITAEYSLLLLKGRYDRFNLI